MTTLEYSRTPPPRMRFCSMHRCRGPRTAVVRLAWAGAEHEVAVCDFHAAGLARVVDGRPDQ